MRPILLSLLLFLVPRLALADEPASFPSRTPGRGLGGSAYLSIGAYDHASPLHERGAFVVLGVPFDRVPRPAAHAVPEPLVPLERTAAAIQPEVIDLGAPARLARSCVSAAWRAAGLGDDDDRLDAIVTRARWSALLPEARFRAIHYVNARFYDTTADTASAYDYAGANTGYEGRLTWRLDRLVYADDEPAFERLRLEHLDARHRIGQRVLEALSQWQRSLLDLRTLPPTQQGTRDEADVVLRVVEAEAALDVLTNGWFGVHKPKAKAMPAVSGPAKMLGEL